jgi:DNA primase catalytic subunit
MDKDHITEKEFLLEWFGLHGRELGDPEQFFSDNPNDIFRFMIECEAEKKPAFMSVQPRNSHGVLLGIEKLFFDFDYADKTFVNKLETNVKDEKEREEVLNIRKTELLKEVSQFIEMLYKRNPRIIPLIIKTRKGYHVYIFLDKIYEVENAKEVYIALMKRMMSNFSKSLKYLDTNVVEDVMRLSRIPFSVHEKSGEKCLIVKMKKTVDGYSFEPDKIRSLAPLKVSGLGKIDVGLAIKVSRDTIKERIERINEAQEANKDSWEIVHGFVGDIRLCFKKALESGEMRHQMRLAMLLEAWYSGKHTFEEIMNVYRPLHDFDGNKVSGESKSRYQIQRFLDLEGYKGHPPYSCDKIQELGWCVREECPIYQRRLKYGIKSKKE